jgi:hypothetical protein
MKKIILFFPLFTLVACAQPTPPGPETVMANKSTGALVAPTNFFTGNNVSQTVVQTSSNGSTVTISNGTTVLLYTGNNAGSSVTVNFPAASIYAAGTGITVVYVYGNTRTLACTRAGSDTINESASAYGMQGTGTTAVVRQFISDGVSNWTVNARNSSASGAYVQDTNAVLTNTTLTNPTMTTPSLGDAVATSVKVSGDFQPNGGIEGGLTGILKGNGSAAPTVAVPGTDIPVFPAVVQTSNSSSGVTINAGTSFLYYTGSNSGTSVVSFPAASGYPSGTGITIVYVTGGVHILSCTRAGSDTINQSAGPFSIIGTGTTPSVTDFISDGVSNWTVNSKTGHGAYVQDTGATMTNLNLTGTVTITNGTFIYSNPTVPVLSTDTGTTGQIAWSSTYFYVCVATNTWVRTPLSTW